ncbi:hypothetical protein IJT10_00635 [bacterium]|nr:hypothetical protein [bacterium]
MKLTYKLVNAPWEDPTVIINLNETKEHWLFDCGDISKISVGTLIGVTEVFITHTHIDHFIGFDRLLRMNLRETKELHFYGPLGMSAQIGHRLQGYSWNLTEDSDFIIKSCDLIPGQDPIKDQAQAIWHTFRAKDKFQEATKERESIKLDSAKLPLRHRAELKFAPLVHGVNCLCYSITEPPQVRVDPQRLKSLNLNPGPWIAQLLDIYKNQLEDPGELTIEGNQYPTSLLKSLLYSPQRSICAYVTDTVFNRQSMASIRYVAEGADLLWCEACYRHAELEKAKQNLHLTSRQVGRIAKDLKVKELRLFHYSRRYKDQLMPHIEEARVHFANTVVPPMM